MRLIPYGKQYIDIKDKKIVLKALSNDLITTGPYVKRLENKLKKYLGCSYSYTCSSGTAAIHLAMMSLELKQDDVILMPAMNFISSYNMAKIMKLKIYLIDVDEYTGLITPDKIIECIKKYKLKNIKALIAMYQGGFPEHTTNFYNLKKKYKFSIIEDACHALGSEYKYKKKFWKVGSCKHSDICTFSMHPLKTITSGEGGIVTTNNPKIARNIELLRSHGILRNKKQYWNYDILKHGFNYRLSDINCALGLSQLKKINFFVRKRKKIYDKYLSEFKNFNSNLIIPKYSKEIKSANHLFIINILFNKINKTKDDFMKYLNTNKIMAQQHYIPIYKFSIFGKKFGKFKDTEKYFNNSVSIPIFVNLNIKDQSKIIKIIKKFFD